MDEKIEEIVRIQVAEAEYLMDIERRIQESQETGDVEPLRYLIN